MSNRRKLNLARIRREIFEDEAMQRELDEESTSEREMSQEDIQRMVKARRARGGGARRAASDTPVKK